MAQLALRVGGVNLTQNEDTWSRTIQDHVLVAAYPLAIWLASSWWRLMYEPLPAQGTHPSIDWRMAHELGAANHGFVWPQIIFASDNEAMQIWAVSSHTNAKQSVRYLNGLDQPAPVPLADFQRSAEHFIADVLSRLAAVACPDTDLANLWQLIQEERRDEKSSVYRRLEAEMGYDPDECPEQKMQIALELGNEAGLATLSELAPLYGESATAPLTTIKDLAASPGMVGTPEVSLTRGKAHMARGTPPWQRAVTEARRIRGDIVGNIADPIDNATLCGLLGLKSSDIEQWQPDTRSALSIAIPAPQNGFKFLPRKKNPSGKRFELARFLGDFLSTTQTDSRWLASTDLHTSRQKYQRAFAAEFLCPIEGLKEYLQDDYSESAQEDAAQYFEVSEQTVRSLLTNNGLIQPNLPEASLPYRITA